MDKIRTTLKIDKHLKERAERVALDEEIHLQDLFGKALSEYLKKRNIQKAKMLFKGWNLGAKLDGLKRDDYYE